MPRKRRNSYDSRLFDIGVCAFCGRNEVDEMLYGKFVVSEDITIHNNCLFFASGLSQEGKNETDGFSGFLLSDIETELRRGKKLFCSYCRKRGGTVGCCEVKCKKSFHLPCGIENGSLHQFFGSFASFCRTHAPKQKVLDVSDDLFCHICCETIFPGELDSCLYSPCCKNSWFHKKCLQKYALSAGLYFFKCPLCNNSKEFIKEMEMHGICIPEKDASWELEDNAYQDLLLKPECDADVCLCPRGRNYCPRKKSGWTLVRCSCCGYHARHKNCENMKSWENSWVCNECKSVEEKIIKSKVSAQAVLNVKEEPTVKDSTPEMNDDTQNLVLAVNCLPSSSTKMEMILEQPTNHPINQPSSSTLDSSTSSALPNFCCKENETVLLQSSITEVTLLNSVFSNNIDSYLNVDVCNNSNIESDVRNTEKVNNSEVLKLSDNISEIEVNPISHFQKSEICSEDKEIKNLKDIKNLSLNALPLRRIASSKLNAVKKVIRKRKFDSSCNSPNHFCIRKYFGQECGKFRI